MIELRVRSQSGDEQGATCSGPARLLDICDAHKLPVPFSCRSASCSTCCVEVLEGHELLGHAEDEELNVLDELGLSPPRFRLACVARVNSGSGRLVLGAENPPETGDL
jgi:2Fe-2S ferredoxin